MFKTYENAWQQIVKPPKYEYFNGSLGAKLRYLPMKEISVERIDFSTMNKNNQRLAASLFKRDKDQNTDRPCVIYLHSHGANRTEGVRLINYTFPEFSLCVFDFSGCGLSEGEYVSLGLKEADDVESIIKELKLRFNLRNFILWGRSMGAVTALMHSEKYLNGEVRALVADSPFSCAKTMVSRLCNSPRSRTSYTRRQASPVS